ncbi:MAG: hypothetical protein ACRDMH_17425 [Solirubrobacterales bacterium]
MLRARHRAWQVGAILLIVLGLGCIALTMVALIAGQLGGWVFLLVGLPVLVLGVAGLRGVDPAVRLAGSLAALACGTASIFISTTALRGLTPAPGTPVASIEPVSMVVGLAFIAAAVLLVVGGPSRKP